MPQQRAHTPTPPHDESYTHADAKPHNEPKTMHIRHTTHSARAQEPQAAPPQNPEGPPNWALSWTRNTRIASKALTPQVQQLPAARGQSPKALSLIPMYVGGEAKAAEAPKPSCQPLPDGLALG